MSARVEDSTLPYGYVRKPSSAQPPYSTVTSENSTMIGSTRVGSIPGPPTASHQQLQVRHAPRLRARHARCGGHRHHRRRPNLPCLPDRDHRYAAGATRAVGAEAQLVGSPRPRTPSREQRTRPTTASSSSATHSAPPPTWPSCFPSTSIEHSPSSRPHPRLADRNADERENRARSRRLRASERGRWRTHGAV